MIYNQIFKGKEIPSIQLLKSLRVQGGSTALKAKLINDINYDNTKILAAGVITTDPAGAIKSTHWVLMGALKMVTWPASKIWKDASKDVQIILRFPDLTVFEFPAASNMSAWNEGGQLDVRFAKKSTKEVIDSHTAYNMGVGDFSARAIIVPGNIHEASVWIGVVPASKEDLAEELSMATVNDHGIPHISLPLEEMDSEAATTFSAGKAVTATMIQQELPNQGLGMAILPFLDCTSSDSEDLGNPDPVKYKEAARAFLRDISMGHPTTAQSYDSALRKHADNSATAMKKAPSVFPEFTAPALAERPAGWLLPSI